MANPATIATPADQWTKVATAVTGGQLHKVISSPMYLQTYRLTGQGAPQGRAEGVAVFEFTDHAAISFAAASDVYIWCDGGAGAVRADL